MQDTSHAFDRLELFAYPHNKKSTNISEISSALAARNSKSLILIHCTQTTGNAMSLKTSIMLGHFGKTVKTRFAQHISNTTSDF